MELINNTLLTSAWSFVISIVLIKVTDPAPYLVQACLVIVLLVSSVSTVILTFIKIWA
jgi:hypothetical protein